MPPLLPLNSNRQARESTEPGIRDSRRPLKTVRELFVHVDEKFGGEFCYTSLPIGQAIVSARRRPERK